MDIEQLDPVSKAAGDTLVQPVTVYDGDSDDEELKEMLGASASWALLESNTTTVVVDDDDDGVEIDIDTDDSVVAVTIGAEATEGLDGAFTQRLRVEDIDGRRKTYTGRLRLHDRG